VALVLITLHFSKKPYGANALPQRATDSVAQIESQLTLEVAAKYIDQLQKNVLRAAVVESQNLQLVFTTILVNGHLLLEDVPEVGKTLGAKAVARSISASFTRTQCTPDLLPSDITGSTLYNQPRNLYSRPGGTGDGVTQSPRFCDAGRY
jgi:MoxR-like ATPase